METVAVLFIFFIIIALALVFYGSYQKSKVTQKLADIKRSESIRIAQTALNLPEISSSRKGVSGINSIDLLKIEAFSSIINNNYELKKGLYEQKFGTSTINIHEIYPEENTWTLYDNPLSKYKSKYSFYLPVSIYNPLQRPSGKYSSGLIEVIHYS